MPQVSRRYRVLWAVCIGVLTVLVVGLSFRLDLINPQEAQASQATLEERVNAYLADANISDGVTELAIELHVSPDDDDLRFAVGFLQFADAVQTFGQSWYQYGLNSQNWFSQIIPFLRLPVPLNPDPDPISNRDFRQSLETFVENLTTAEETLSQIQSEAVQLGVYFGRAYLDFDADGQGSDPEALWRIYAELNRGASITAEQAETFLIKLDAGDVQWLRGYCHFLSALLEFYLAHDDSRLFDHTAHLFFEKPETSYSFLRNIDQLSEGYISLMDAAAFIHLVALPVQDRNRSQAAIAHLQQMIQLSRETWALYGQETDDDHEWIPNPNQTGVVPGVTITEEMVQQWLSFLDEADSILAGETLVPFWRGNSPVGVNLNRVFMEPQGADLVLWVQGTAAAPYLEDGTLTQPEFWQRLWNSFNGRFVGFALWFN